MTQKNISLLDRIAESLSPSPETLAPMKTYFVDMRREVSAMVEKLLTPSKGIKEVPHMVKLRLFRRGIERDILGAFGEVIKDDRVRNPDDLQAGSGVYRLGAIPGSNILLVTDPKINEAAFRNLDNAFGRDPKILEPLVGSSALSEDPTTEAWRKKRAAIDAHTGPHLKTVHQQAMKREINEKLENLKSDDLVNPFAFTQTISFGVMARLMIGDHPSKDALEQKRILDQSTQTLNEEAIQLILNPIINDPTLRKHLLPRLYPEFVKAKENLKAAIQQLIVLERANIKDGNPNNSFLAGLLQPITYEECGVQQEFTLTDEEIIGEFVSLILAGSLTTANTMARVLYLAAYNPEIKDKMDKDIDKYLTSMENSTARITNLSPRNLPYVYAVICETLRIYPPGSLAIRRMNKNTTIQGVEFQSNDMVILDLYHPQIDENTFKNPTQFDPNRFSKGLGGLNENQKQAYRPFGFGPTICPGRNFAIEEICWLMVRLREKKLRFASAGYPEPISGGDVTMEPKKGTQFKLFLFKE